MPVVSRSDPIKELRLRPFVATDEAEVTSWFGDAGALRFFAGPRLTWPLDDSQWERIRLDRALTAWTAVMGDDPIPVGHGELVEESASIVRLARIAVAPAERGHGVGRALVSALIEKSRAGGYSLATLFVHPDNSTAVRAYRGLGFEPVAAPEAHGSLRMELSIAG